MLAALVNPPAKLQLFKDPRRCCGRHLYITRKSRKREWSPTQLCVSQRRAHKDEPVCLRQFAFREEDGSSDTSQRPHHVGDYEDGKLVMVARFHGASPTSISYVRTRRKRTLRTVFAGNRMASAAGARRAIFDLVIDLSTFENANWCKVHLLEETSHGRSYGRLDRSHHNRRDCRLAGRAIHEE